MIGIRTSSNFQNWPPLLEERKEGKGSLSLSRPPELNSRQFFVTKAAGVLLVLSRYNPAFFSPPLRNLRNDAAVTR